MIKVSEFNESVKPWNKEYKGYIIRLNNKTNSYDIYDKYRELEDSGFTSVKDAMKAIDELEFTESVKKPTTVKYYVNKRNKNKYLEVHADGYGHYNVVQFLRWSNGVENKTGDRILHRWRVDNLSELLADYDECLNPRTNPRYTSDSEFIDYTIDDGEGYIRTYNDYVKDFEDDKGLQYDFGTVDAYIDALLDDGEIKVFNDVSDDEYNHYFGESYAEINGREIEYNIEDFVSYSEACREYIDNYLKSDSDLIDMVLTYGNLSDEDREYLTNTDVADIDMSWVKDIVVDQELIDRDDVFDTWEADHYDEIEDQLINSTMDAYEYNGVSRSDFF